MERINMRDATLCFLVNEKQVLLGFKKRGFGSEKFNGFGGKVEEHETVEEAAVRELFEEVGVKTSLDNITKVAELAFYFPHVSKEKKWDQVVHVFLVNKWEGEPAESEEMRPVWFDVEKLPFEKMWQDDQHWLPMVLQDKLVKGKFSFEEDNETIKDMDLKETDDF